jgi:hypothetical protein
VLLYSEKIKNYFKEHSITRLSALAMLNVGKVMIENITNFNDKVIDTFACCKVGKWTLYLNKIVKEVMS